MAYGDLPLDAPLKPNKGMEGGACNRQSCQAEPALYYNHGSGAWYCEDCKRDIGMDIVNLRDWELRWRPRLGHAMFETREEIDAREAKLAAAKEAKKEIEHRLGDEYWPYFTKRPPIKPKSASLERMLRKARR
jgi:hypothetical protein